MISSALSAVTRALIGPSFDAFIADHSAPEGRARLFGITQTLFGVVSVVGPVLGGFMVEAFGFKVMLSVAAGFYLIATVMRVSMARDAAKGQESNPTQLSVKSLKLNLKAILVLILAGGLLTWIMITDGVRDIFFNMSFSFLSVYMQDIAGLSISQIGIMSSIFGLAMMAVMIPAGWLADKAGERVNIAISFLLMAISIGLIALLPSVERSLDVWRRLDHCRVRCWPVDPGIPVFDQQGGSQALARRRIWNVQHQPGSCLASRPADRWIFVGKCQPPLPVPVDLTRLLAFHHPGLAEIQGQWRHR